VILHHHTAHLRLENGRKEANAKKKAFDTRVENS
jgi:hypothetical protein